jgi:hypothetical protein
MEKKRKTHTHTLGQRLTDGIRIISFTDILAIVFKMAKIWIFKKNSRQISKIEVNFSP